MEWENKPFSVRPSIIYSSLTMASFLLKMNKEAENSPSTPKTFLSRTANPLEVLNFSFFLPKIFSPLLCFYLVIFFIHRYYMFWGTSNTTHVELTSASSESELWHSYISILTSIISFFLLQFLGLYLFKLDRSYFENIQGLLWVIELSYKGCHKMGFIYTL